MRNSNHANRSDQQPIQIRVEDKRGARLMRALVWITLVVLVLLLAGWLALRAPDIPVATLRARYASPASRFIEVMPGLVVHMRDEGPSDALPIILLHGSNGSLHTWEPWVARLKDRYRLITYDAPAHGLTGAAPDARYTQAAYERVLEAVVRERGLARFVLVGHSMGGGVAVRYAADHPGRVVALILVDASGEPYPDGGTSTLLRIARLPVIRDLVAVLTPRSPIVSSLSGAVSNKAILTPAAIDRYWNLLRYPGNRVATIERFAQGYQSVSPADLARVTAPTLILWGREDRFIPVASARYFARALPHNRAVIYDGIGHLPMEETSDRSADDVRAFLTGFGDGATGG